jgi:CD109 antigen
MRYKRLMAAGISMVTLVSMLPGCSPTSGSGKIDSYIAMAPLVLQSGGREAVSVTLLSGEKPVAGDVVLSLLKNNAEVLTVSERIDGKGIISFDVPGNSVGDYTLRIKGDGFQNEGNVKIAVSSVILLETDKPIYKPGQTIMVRVVTVNADLIPVSREVTIEALDAKGIKIFRKVVTTDDYGMAKLEMPLSDEPNLGVWKLTATSGAEKTQLDVRVEKYVLPKYEVKVNLPKEWFLISERIKGNIKAEYSFGKPVNGDLIIKASKYVGTWQQFATFNAKVTDGAAEFDIPAAGYVAGVPGAGGQGNVRLEITVAERATGYVENTERLLTIAQSGTIIQIIPPASNFKPGLPFDFMIITESPDNQMKDVEVQVSVTAIDKDFKNTTIINKKVNTIKGKAVVQMTPTASAVALTINCSTSDANAYKAVTSAYSPTSSFIHVEQSSEGVPDVGAEVKFKVYATKESPNLYYEVVSRGRVVFTDFVSGTEISFKTMPLMAPSSRLLVYQILANSEVAADYIPFKVNGDYPQDIQVTFGKNEVKPGDKVDINIQTQGEAKVGLAAVDRSVFILAENRLNLEQVFAELERLYMQPQAELHEVTIFPVINTRGAKEVFQDAQVLVLSGNKIPAGQDYNAPGGRDGFGGIFMAGGAQEKAANGAIPPGAVPAPSPSTGGEGLAVVERVRQYFPETWVWQDVVTNLQGKATIQVTAPDSITTWALRAIALSKKNGLGITEDELRVFQPFFLSCDLPYSAVRSEEFPVKIAVYNYLNTTQQVTVKIEPSAWFDLLDKAEKVITIAGNDIGGTEFIIRPKMLGVNQVKVTAQSKEMADAVLKDIIIDAEGVAREVVDNLTLGAGADKTIDTSLPALIVDGSGRVYVTVTAGFLTQTIDGLDKLIQMPFGCGEQNMIVFAPDVYITKYLKASGQLKPEIMAKAEKLMVTGYQRELTYRHKDGSFSAFGESDKDGSLWLTAFVLKCFAQAKGLIYIDDSILTSAAAWLKTKQNIDGSFDQFGFVHHQEMIGGVKGKTALTAFVANALLEAGEKDAAAKAVAYLEGQLDTIDDPYALALTAYVLELAGSNKRNAAHDKLMIMAVEDANGLHWGKEEIVPLPAAGAAPKMGGVAPFMMPPRQNPSAQIENTAYAMLALTKHGDAFNASRAAKWLTSKRNANGGFGSTQDTVVALQALTEFAANQKSDVDLKVNIVWSNGQKEIKLTPDNFDVLQIVQVPAGEQVKITAVGKGEAVGQVVKRFNVPEADKPEQQILKVDVSYDTTQVAVNDIVKVSASVTFNPPEQVESGMVVLDISVPTGFTPVIESVEAAVKNDARLKRYDVAGRKVIFYIENLKAGEKLSLTFDVKAMYPVKAKGVASVAYSYYTPDMKGESLSQDVTVIAR